MPTVEFSNLMIDFELKQMSEYLHLLHSSLESHIDKINKEYKEAKKIPLLEDQSILRDVYFEDEYYVFTEKYPQLMLVGFITMWYSFIEQELIGFCQEKKLTININPKDKDYLEKGIRRARKFLLIAKGYEIDQAHWNTLVLIGKLRNYLVHEGDQFMVTMEKPDAHYVEYEWEQQHYYCCIESDLFTFLEKNKILDIAGMIVKIKVTFEYCQSLIDFGQSLFVKLYEGVK